MIKTLFTIILALGVGFVGAYVVLSRQNAARLEPLNAAAPAATEVAAAPALVEKIVTVSVPATPVEASASDILNDLLNVNLAEGNGRNAGLRRVVFKMELLAQRGKRAVPAIREFIGRNVDVDYSQPGSLNNSPSPADANAGGNRGFNRGNNGGAFGGRGGARRARDLGSLQTDWVVPPSLRLGLLGTLKEIGGEEPEAAMAEMLSTTGRGVEVAYLAVMLEEMAPGRHGAAAVAAAKELLMNPPAIDSPDRLDELAKSYLYGVLEYFNDTSFAINAQQMLVGKDGRLDQDALDYLSTVTKELSVSALYAAYENPALTNQFDKQSIGREVLNYVGQNSQANALFTETLNDPGFDPRSKAFTVMQLAGGISGPDPGDAPLDPQVVSGRVVLLNSLLAQPQFANDPALSKVIPATIAALQTGQPVQPPDIFGGGNPNRRQRQPNNNGGGDAGN